jgi:hypothetical protein
MTILNLGTKTTVLSFIPNDVVTATATGSSVDLQGYEGDIAVILDAEAGSAGVTYAVKLTHSDVTGSGFADAGVAFATTAANTASVQKIYANVTDLKRFVRVVVTVAGGTGAGAVSVTGLASAKYG